MMEAAAYTPNNTNFADVWRMKPYHHHPHPHQYGLYGEATTPARSPVDTVNISATIPLPPVVPPGPDTEWLPFSPCTPHPYKEYAIMKGDKQPHDVADTMLTLKHAVLHSSMYPPMSPMSPGLPPHFSQSLASPQQTGPSFYTVGHGQPQFVSNTFSPGAFSAQYTEPSGATQGQGMFPSMSVNVSMSMNLGMPAGFTPGQYPPQLGPQQWSSYPNTSPQYQHNYSPLSDQYTAYPPQPYAAAYSLSSEFRSKADVRVYKDRFCPDDSRYSSKAGFSSFNRAKVMQYRSSQSPIIDDPSKINLCQICGKSYARPSTLKTHMRTHSGEKPYRCGTCHKSFSQAANLTAHMRTHSGEKPFRCPICDRRFSQSSSVTTHMRTHSGERPYRCQMCKKAFSDSSTLTKHLRIHSGEKPYQCKLCLLRFSQSGNLNRHMRVHANNNT